MKLLLTKTLEENAASIEFTSIPQTFTDLVFLFSGRGTAGGNADGLIIRFNGISTDYSTRRLFVADTTVGSDTNLGQFVINASGSTANTFSSVSCHIPNYAGSTKKSFSIDGVGPTNTSGRFNGIGAVLWSNTSAINAILLTSENVTSNLVAGSTVSLYGILKGSDGNVTTSP